MEGLARFDRFLQADRYQSWQQAGWMHPHLQAFHLHP